MHADNPVLREIVETGHVQLPGGERVPVSSQIDPACGALLRACVERVKPRVAVEVGLAYGISTLYILDGLEASGGGKLIGMDPAQFDGFWRGGGLHSVERAGYRDRYEFHEESSQSCLPRLASLGQRVGLGFIDGWHTFDHVLVDFFNIDRMLDVGGAVVFDDVGYPAIRRVCEFVVANRAYEIIGAVKHPPARSWRQRAKRAAWRITLPLHRTDRTPAPQTRARLAALADAYFLALRKTADDGRRFDHFVPF